MPAALAAAGYGWRMDPVRALVVSDDPISRSGLAALLAERPDLSVVGRVASREAPGAAQRRGGPR